MIRSGRMTLKDKTFDADIEGLRAFQQVKMWMAEEKGSKKEMHRQPGCIQRSAVDKA